MSFADLGLSDELLRAVADSGYDEPTPIQAGVIPSVLMGRDIIGIAQTGTGKTAGFVLPMIDILDHGRSRARMPRSLILEPTRELAAQVAENFEKYGKYHKLSMALLIGGVQMGDQVKALEKGVDVLIATPGRLMDLFGRGKILLTGCNLLVIDEADRMLDMGFIPDIEEICTKLPKQRQTLLFSATMPPPIKKLADKFLTDPKTIEATRPATANVNIEQRLVEVARRQEARRAARHAARRGVQERDRLRQPQDDGARARHQPQALRLRRRPDPRRHGAAGRIAEFDRFKSGEINILVASDVAARGLDVKGVSHVINFDVPWQPDDYIHRIGRTGRAGMNGIAITLATREDREAVAAIEKLTGHQDRPHGGEAARREAPAAEPARKPEKAKRRGASARKGREARAEGRAAARARRMSSPGRGRAEGQGRAPKAKPRLPRERQPEPAEEADDDGWNGPMPGFLSKSA